MTSAAIIVPARDAGPLLDPCLRSLQSEAVAANARVVVVDDGSHDDTRARALALGTTVIDGEGRGPYHARNLGWRGVEASTLVFVDARCRARPGWLALLLEALKDPSIAIAGGNVLVPPGRTVAERIAHREQPLLATRGTADPFLPWLPAANLATRRSVLVAVGGFDERRGGADVDLCWRVQLAGLGHLVTVPGAEMDWAPRSSLHGTLTQFRRYGRNHRRLLHDFADAGCRAGAVRTLWREAGAQTAAALMSLRRERIRDWPVPLGLAACRVAFNAGYHAEERRLEKEDNENGALPP